MHTLVGTHCNASDNFTFSTMLFGIFSVVLESIVKIIKFCHLFYNFVTGSIGPMEIMTHSNSVVYYGEYVLAFHGTISISSCMLLCPAISAIG